MFKARHWLNTAQPMMSSYHRAAYIADKHLYLAAGRLVSTHILKPEPLSRNFFHLVVNEQFRPHVSTALRLPSPRLDAGAFPGRCSWWSASTVGGNMSRRSACTSSTHVRRSTSPSATNTNATPAAAAMSHTSAMNGCSPSPVT